MTANAFISAGGSTAAVMLAANEVGWPSYPGVSPVTRVFQVTPRGLRNLLRTVGKPVTLHVDDDRFENLYVIRRAPGPNPRVEAVVLADRRVFWPFKHVKMSINQRRRNGYRRRGSWQEELQQDVVAKLQWKENTLFAPDTPWRATTLLTRVIKTVDPEARLRIDSEGELNPVPIEALELDDPGDGAIQQVLGRVPGAEITVDPDGTVRLFNRLNSKDQFLVGVGGLWPEEQGTTGPEIDGGGHIVKVVEHGLRPEFVRVWFTIEAEIRMDYVDDDLGGEAEVDATGRRDGPFHPRLPRVIENVIQVPDFRLAAADGLPDMSQGNFVNFGRYLQRLRAEGGVGAKLTEKLVRRAAITKLGLWKFLNIAGARDLNNADVSWAARFGAIRSDFRSLFRILPEWVDRFDSVRAHLVANNDLLSGQRAPALALGDICVAFNLRGTAFNLKKGLVDQWATNIPGYPGKNVAIASNKVSHPGRIQFTDAEQGVLRLRYNPDPYGKHEEVYPSFITGIPSRGSPFNANRQPLSFDLYKKNGVVAELSENMQVAFLFTATPVVTEPNQMYYVDIRAEQVAKMLPEAIREGLGRTVKGLRKDVRIPAAVETARIAWKEDQASVIESIFGVGNPPPEPADYRNLLINGDGPSDQFTGASLQSLAEAAAAAVYARTPARVYGAKTIPMNLGLKVDGHIAEIDHALNPNGAKLSRITIAEDVTALDMFAFMDAGTRQVVLKQIQGPENVSGS